MDGVEIKKKIDANNKLIEKEMNPAMFVLNKNVQKLLEENSMLRAQCAHEYDQYGICIYCYQEDER